jgi:hypothetical protein
MPIPQKTTEEDIFRLAVEAFRKAVPTQLEIETAGLTPLHDADAWPGRVIRMVINGTKQKYYAEIRATVTKAQRGLFLVNIKQRHYPLLLVAKYVNPQMAELLREDGIEFIDTVGNVFINQPPIYIFVKGNKPPKAGGQPRVKRAFKAAALKILYLFLCKPGFENKTYREIAAATDVALGTVDWTMKELKELGFLIDMGKKGLKLTQKENLLQRWVTAYPEQLRPKRHLGRYRGQPDWWRQKRFDPQKAQWGGEVAAERLTRHLQPELITVYAAAQHLDQILIENRLKKDITGDVEILERFWKPAGEQPQDDLVHPILVYADLVATGNQRNLETAKIIYEQHIIRHIRED